MKKIMILLAFLLCLQVGYAQKTDAERKIALDFNDFCADISDSTYRLGLQLGGKIKEGMGTREMKGIKPLSKQILSYLDKQAVLLKNKKIPLEMEILRTMMLTYINVEKEFLVTFDDFENLPKGFSDEAFKVKYDKLMSHSQKEADVLADFNKVAEACGIVFGYKIRDDENDD
ncbi:hypothetical protein [Sphingobacterium kyonggiense]